MSYNAKNHTEQGGEKTIIGGKVVIESGAEVEIKEGAEVTGLPASGTKLYLHKLQVTESGVTKTLKIINANSNKITKKGTELINYLFSDDVLFKSFEGSPIFRFAYRGTNNMTTYYLVMNSDSGTVTTETTTFNSNSYVDTVTEI